MRSAVLLTFLLSNFGILSAQNCPTVREIYNFDVGDVFHYKDSYYGIMSYSKSYERHRITKKYYSNDLDTVFHEIINSTYSESYFASSGYTIKTDSSTERVKYTNLDSSIFSQLVYEFTEENCKIDTYSLLNCGRVSLSFNCTGGAADWATTEIYGVGIGRMSRGRSIAHCSNSTPTLIYYNKQSDSCGNKITVSLNDDKFKSPEFKIYPNPVDVWLSIESSQKIDFIQVLNLQGQELLRSQSTRIQMDHLSSGLYILRIHSDSDFYDQKSVKN